MADTPAGDSSFKLLLKNGSESFGYFDYEPIKKGTDGGEISRCPERGVMLRPGLDTAEAFDISRPWIIGVERKVKARLEQLKNRQVIQAFVFEFDPFTKQPTSSEPVESLSVMIREVTTPKGSANSSEESRLVVNIEPKP